MLQQTAVVPGNFVRLWSAFLRQSGAISFVAFVVVVLTLIAVSPKSLSYFDLSTISASATTLALAGIGETIVVLGGGLDLSLGAVISLVNVILVTQLGSAALSTAVYTFLAAVIAIGIGAAICAINGALVSYLRLPSIIVTLATMFVLQVAQLMILK
jgi:ribose transport system permease protein